MTQSLHIHCDSRRAANPVFHMTDALCAAALARRPDLARHVRITTGWDLENAAGALETADVFVGFRLLKEKVRTAPKLKVVHLIGAGVEHLRPLDWVPDHLMLTNNRGIHQQKAGEYILMALLMLNSRLPTLVNAQAQRQWLQLFTTQIKGKTLLIVGAGELGSAGARQAKLLDLHVIGVRRSAKANPDCDETYGPERLHELLPRADFVLVTVPATAETEQMIGEREFAMMKPGASFINFGRAAVVDYEALSRRLKSGAIAGAVLDVFDPEPLPAESYLWGVPNLIITPHCSSDDAQSYIPMTLDLVLDNAGALLSGRALRNVVSSEHEY